MRNYYKIVLSSPFFSDTEIHLNCSRTQAERVFFALAFAITQGAYSKGALYLYSKRGLSTVINFFKVVSRCVPATM